ncbi:related to MSH4-meiosis-specific [Lecanosticta acicola]|uniref:DNA mismatch repair protein MSH3 n=1 Tax=Lecanosticta acicola TaxID=111012 RepID=A0AAI8YTG1_9PEZI|nr:related to MSH4-meiosis-specific [Lecanosticta acicola]
MDRQHVMERLREILKPELLTAAYLWKWPWPKSQQPNGAEVGHFHFQPSSDQEQAFYDLVFYQVIKPISDLSLNALLDTDWTRLLPESSQQDYPEKALGLITIIDQFRILGSGYGKRYTRAFFDPLAEKLARQLIGLPMDKRPDGKAAWMSRGYSFEEWIVRTLWFFAPPVHSDKFMTADRAAVKEWLHYIRAELEEHSHQEDPFAELEPADDVDIRAFERILIAGPPKKSYADPKKEATTYDYAFWWIRILNSHFAVTDMCGHYPYWRRWEGFELTEEDETFMRATTVFGYLPEDEAILQQVRQDKLDGVWQPLPSNPEFEKSKRGLFVFLILIIILNLILILLILILILVLWILSNHTKAKMDPRRRPPSTSRSTSRSSSYSTAINNGTTTSYRISNHNGTGTGTGNLASTSHTTTKRVSTSNPFYTAYDTTESRPPTRRQSAARPGTAATTRPRTGYSTLGVENQEVICAVSESRGISPSVGLAFINLDTSESVLCQLNDSQTYVRTTHKLAVFNPSQILVISSIASPKTKLFSIIEDSLESIDADIVLLDRQYWSEGAGLDYVDQLAFESDVESIKTSVSGKYYTVCSFAALMKYADLGLARRFSSRSLRIKYEPSEGSMMIDVATLQSLELVQNLCNPQSRDCLFGLLNETLTYMGGRLLRSNILQPVTDPETLGKRYDAVEELSTKEEMFYAVRQALKPFLDGDKILTQLISVPKEASPFVAEQAINNVIMLKHLVSLVKPVFEALTGARSEMLQTIRLMCTSENTEPVEVIINNIINEDTSYARAPLDLRNQRTYAVKSGLNGLLDVARQTYKESMEDALTHIEQMAEEHSLPLQTKFDNKRQFFLRIRADELEGRDLPPVFINVYKNKDCLEFQTLDIVKRNQKIGDAHMEVVLMSDNSIKQLIEDVRGHMANLFKICECVAMLDMLCSFAHLVSIQDYTRPMISETLAIRAGRHPIREKIHSNIKFIPNDVYATQQTRTQIITGCNMSGKSTYIRSIALMTIMAQIGSFVPAQHAAFPIIRQLFARVSLDDSIEANVSTFSAEMRETAFILRNIDRSSMAIMDELGRGTSTRDGIAIALAIAEALVESRALVWFATHFRDLANIMRERNGVINLHLAVDMSEDDKMEMLYRVAQGTVEEQHYGLKLAKVLPFPPDVLQHAELVATTIEQQTQQRKKNSIGIVNARRRKLLLNVKEHLLLARDSKMDDTHLKGWLQNLQNEFVALMSAQDEEEERLAGWVEPEGEEDFLEEDQAEQSMDSAEQSLPRIFVDGYLTEHNSARSEEESTGRSTAGDTSRHITTTS